MPWRALRTRSRRWPGLPACGDPTKAAELHLVKVPVDRADPSFASGKQVNLAVRSARYINVMMRRGGILASRLIASLRAG